MSARQIIATIAAVVAVVVLILVWALTPSAPGSESPLANIKSNLDGTKAKAKKEEVEQAEKVLKQSLMLIPPDAYTVTHANMSSRDGVAKWWENYVRFLPAGHSLPMIISEEFEVSALTYGGFTNWELHEEGVPFSWVIILSLPEDNRDALVEYLNENNNDGAYFVHTAFRDGQAYVAVAPTNSFNTVDELARALDSASDDKDSFADSDKPVEFDVDSKDPMVYYDFSLWLDTLLAYVPEGESFFSDFLNDTVRSKWFGFTDKSQFIGTSVDQGETWQGSFVTDGIDTSQIDLELVTQEIEEQEVWWSGADPDDALQWGYWTDGLGAVQYAASVAVGSDTVGYVENLHKHSQEPLVAEADGNKVHILISPQGMQNALHSSVEPYGVKAVSILVDPKGEAEVKFIFFTDDDFSS